MSLMRCITLGIVAAGMAVASILATAAGAGPDGTRGGRDARAALPGEKELQGFDSLVYDAYASGAMVEADRLSDGMRVRVSIAIAHDIPAARRAVSPSVSPLPMAVRSWTGRKVGDEVLISNYTGGGPPRGAFTLRTRTGSAAVTVKLMHKITPGAGEPVQPVFADADLRWAEDLAIGCVEKLKKLGYGDAQEKQTQSRTKGKKKSKGT